MVFPLYWADTHSKDFGNGRSLWGLDTPVVPYWCDLWTANAPTVIFTRLHLKSNWGSLDLSVHREAINKLWISFTLPELGVKFRHSAREIILSFTCHHLITNTIVCEKITIVLTVVIFRFDKWLPEIKIHCSCRKLTETEIDAHLVSIAERDWRFNRRLHDNKQPFVTCFKNISINYPNKNSFAFLLISFLSSIFWSHLSIGPPGADTREGDGVVADRLICKSLIFA